MLFGYLKYSAYCTINTMYDENSLHQLGRNIGRIVRGGETLELIGDVGAGKTTLTKAIAIGMGIEAPIQSPTFTISNRYEAPSGLTLAHYDFYRLHDAGVMADELAETAADTQAVVVVEWGDIIRDVLPEDRLTIRITAESDTMRHLVVEAHGDRSEEMKKEIV